MSSVRQTAEPFIAELPEEEIRVNSSKQRSRRLRWLPTDWTRTYCLLLALGLVIGGSIAVRRALILMESSNAELGRSLEMHSAAMSAGRSGDFNLQWLQGEVSSQAASSADAYSHGSMTMVSVMIACFLGAAAVFVGGLSRRHQKFALGATIGSIVASGLTVAVYAVFGAFSEDAMQNDLIALVFPVIGIGLLAAITTRYFTYKA